MISPILHSIHPATILPKSYMGFNIYLSNREGEKPIKFISSNQWVNDSDCGMLRGNPVLRVFIDSSSLNSYREYLGSYANQWMSDPDLPSSLKSSLLLDCVQAKWRQGASSNDWQYLAGLARDISVPSAEFISVVGMKITDVLQTMDLGVDLTTHSLRTAIYSTILGNEIGCDRKTLVEICIGGLLHDIGKRHIGDETDDHYDSEERRLAAHPTIGFRRLCHLTNFPKLSLLMCYQHHETMDGSGTPVQLADDEIHFASRICAIANRFDKLTSNENPRMAYSAGAAGRILEQDRSKRYDPEMMKTWLTLLKSHLKNSSTSTHLIS